MIHRVSIVLATYCPHCVPFSLRNAEIMAQNLGVPLRVLNIECPPQELLADQLVKEHGDWSEDYLIPQVFVEYVDGRVIHLLTGFSEAVSATELAWDALFASNFYKHLIHVRGALHDNTLKDIVEKYVTFSGQCRGHCTKSTSLIELWSNRTKIVKASVCPDGYVSRVIAFSMHPDWSWFKDFLVNQGVEAIVRDRDLRPASRHGWELRTDISSTVRHISPTGNIYEVYWTTYPKTDEERRRGLFICSDDAPGAGCKRLFVQNINSQNRRCPKCGT